MPGLGLGITARRGGLSPAIAASLPSLDLDFLKQGYQMSLIGKAFSEIFTFSRASTGTRINASGVIETIAANQPRFDYDPVTLQAKGLLIEEQRTNMCSQSNPNNAAWTLDGVTKSTDATLTPAGEVACLLTMAAVQPGNRAMIGGLSLGAGTHTLSCFVKAGTATKGSLAIDFATPNQWLVFDLASPPAGSVDYGNGWWRIPFVVTLTAGGTQSVNIGFYQVATKAAGNSMYFGGVMVEANSSFPTSYIPTSGSQVTRAADKPNVPAGQWLKALQGTLYVEYSDDCLNSSTLAQLSSGDGGAAVWIVRGTNGVNCMVNSGGAYRSAPAAGVSRAVHKAAVTWDAAGNFMSCCDGQAVASNTQSNGAPPITGGLRIGCDNLVAAWANGHIRAAKYLPATRTAAQLQALTA